MAKASLAKIEAHCNQLLRLRGINDYDGALNGLQVENHGAVTRIAAAVDASLVTARLAAANGANLLVVHHGLFWSQRQPWTGSNYQLMRFLFDNDLAVYSAHLPLDIHPRLGNNAQLCRALRFRSLRPFFFEKKQFIGLQTKTSIDRDERSLGDAVCEVARPDHFPGNIGEIDDLAGAVPAHETSSML